MPSQAFSQSPEKIPVRNFTSPLNTSIIFPTVLIIYSTTGFTTVQIICKAFLIPVINSLPTYLTSGDNTFFHSVCISSIKGLITDNIFCHKGFK